MRKNLLLHYMLGISTILMAASIALMNPYIIVLSILSIFMSIVVYRGWYIIEAFVFTHSNLIEICDGFELNGSRNTAIRKNNNEFCATAAAYVEGSVKPIEQGDLENLISKIDFTFKYIVHLKQLNADNIIDTLKTKRAMKEIELSKLGNSPKDSIRKTKIKNQIEIINNDINIMSSSKPLELARYIITTGRAQSRIAAEEVAHQQLREITGKFSALTNATCKELSGDELIEAINFIS
ncbi:MAG: hypothetical protein ACP5TL_01010 [Candidatus Micrarchaeia archaeon]